MDTRKRTFGWGDAIAVFVMAFVLLSVVYPILAQRDHRTRGIVVDDDFRHIPGAVLEIRARDGKDLGRVTTDANGEVLWNPAWRTSGTTFGNYGIARFSPASRGGDRIFLAPLVSHRVRVQNAATGLPQPDLTIHVDLDARTRFSLPDFHEATRETTASGEFAIGSLPATVRTIFYTNDKSLVVWNVVSKIVWNNEPPYQKEVLYDVSVVPTGTLTGQAVYPDDTTVLRGIVFATLISTAPDGESRYERAAIDPATKTFRMRGLLPGRWRVGYEPWYGARDKSQGEREVLIQSGETKTLGEPLRVYWTNDKP